MEGSIFGVLQKWCVCVCGPVLNHVFYVRVCCSYVCWFHCLNSSSSFSWYVPLTVMHRRRRIPEGDWTSLHPWSERGPSPGELCWSGARPHPHHPPRLLCRASDRVHRSVKNRGLAAILFNSAAPCNKEPSVQPGSSHSMHKMSDCSLGGKSAVSSYLRSRISEKHSQFLLATGRHILRPMFYFSGYFKIGLQSLAGLEASES